MAAPQLASRQLGRSLRPMARPAVAAQAPAPRRAAVAPRAAAPARPCAAAAAAAPAPPRRQLSAAAIAGLPALPPQQQRRCRSVRVEAAKKAAVAATAAVFPALQSAIAPYVPGALAAAFATLGAVALLLAFVPASSLARRAARSNTPYVVLAVAYGVVLAASWQGDTLSLMMPGSLADGFRGGFNPQFFPSLDGVSALFSRAFASASFLLHVIFINLFAARAIYNHGWEARLPTSHSVLLAALAGPLGVVSHLVTQLAYALLGSATGRDLRPRSRAVKAASGAGVIVVMPYEER